MKNSFPVSRRAFLASAGAYLAFPYIARAQTPVLGQGEFRYRVVPGWGQLGVETPVKNCHGIVITREGNIVLLTDHTANNVIVYSPEGRLLNKWGTGFPGAHGLSLVEENGKERLFITDLQTHRVVKTSLDGRILSEWLWPEETGKYSKESDYRPSWTLHLPDGGFIVMDGYGKDYFTHYGADGKLVRIFGGAEGGIVHWGPHGGMTQQSPGGEHTLLVAMSDQQYLLRLDPQGKELDRIPLPGGNPRQIRRWQSHFVCAHLADNWPKDRNSRGFISILDRELRVVSNVGGTAPEYDDAGILRQMRSDGETFVHPHDVVAGKDGALYVGQFASGNTYPVKLERI